MMRGSGSKSRSRATYCIRLIGPGERSGVSFHAAINSICGVQQMTIMNRRDALKLATIGAATVAGSTAASAAQAGVKLEGKWKYQSFRPYPGSLAAEPKNPTFVLW